MANDGDSALVRDSLLFWVNALDIGNCMLVDDLAELADGRILLEIVTSLESVRVPAATTPASRAEAAIRLLGQKHGFGRLPSRLTPPGSASEAIAAADVGAICALLQYVRGLHATAESSSLSQGQSDATRDARPAEARPEAVLDAQLSPCRSSSQSPLSPLP